MYMYTHAHTHIHVQSYAPLPPLTLADDPSIFAVCAIVHTNGVVVAEGEVGLIA